MGPLAAFVADLRSVSSTSVPRVSPELAALLESGLPASSPAAAPARFGRLRWSCRRLSTRIAAVTVLSTGTLAFAGAANALPAPVQQAVADVARAIGISMPHPGEVTHQRPEPAPSMGADDRHGRDGAAEVNETEAEREAEADHGVQSPAPAGASAPAANAPTAVSPSSHHSGSGTQSGPGRTGRQTGTDGSAHETTETGTETHAEPEAGGDETTATTEVGTVDVSHKPVDASGGGAKKGR